MDPQRIYAPAVCPECGANVCFERNTIWSMGGRLHCAADHDGNETCGWSQPIDSIDPERDIVVITDGET